MKSCLNLTSRLQYKKWQGLAVTLGTHYDGQPFVISDIVPQNQAWLVLALDALFYTTNMTSPSGNLQSIEGYLIPPVQSPPKIAGGNNAADYNFFGDWEGLLVDTPPYPDRNGPPILDAIRIDTNLAGAQAIQGTSFHIGESKNLMPNGVSKLLVPPGWAMCAYTGLYGATAVGNVMIMRAMFAALTLEQADKILIGE
jgi:hypothetical protein